MFVCMSVGIVDEFCWIYLIVKFYGSASERKKAISKQKERQTSYFKKK